MKSKHKWLICGLLIAIVVAVAGMLVVPRWRSAASRRNILLITFDTTRADHIGAYGYRNARTPAIDRLAEEGILFHHVSAPVPLTLPSHTAMLTGLYPFYSGVRDNSHFSVNEQAETLAERLGERGYQTGAVVAAFVLDSRFGLDQGFDQYNDDLPGKQAFDRFQIPERNAQRIVDAAIAWLEETSPNQPFFLWCHFYDPHHPYRTPTSFPYYLSHPYDQEIAFADFHLQRLLDHLNEKAPNNRPTAIAFAGDHGEGFGENGEETHGFFVYDGTIRVPLIIKTPDGSNAGAQVETPVSLVDILPTLLDLAGLPVPADDEIHGRSLLPLVGDGIVAEEAKEAFNERPIYFECYSPMYNLGFAPVRGVRVNQTKLIDSPEAELYVFDENPREGFRHSVYAARPELATGMMDALLDLVDEPLRTPPLSSEEHSLDLEVVQKLRSLGYLALEGAAEKEWGPEDDLKRMLPVYNKILAASDTIGIGDIEDGTKMLVEVLTEDPDNPRALWLLAEAVVADPDATPEGLPLMEAAAMNLQVDAAMRVPFLINCGRAYLVKQEPQRALTFLQSALELAPDDPTLLGWFGVTYLNLGQFANAVEATEKVLQIVPHSVPPQVVLGLAHFCDGQIKQAANAWQTLLVGGKATVWDVAAICARDPAVAARAIGSMARAAIEPSISPQVQAALHATNGQILLNAGQFAQGLTALNAACALLEPDDVQGLWWRARALTFLQRLDQAQQLLERAYALAPNDIRVVADLAATQHQLGNTKRAVELLATYLESTPEDPTAANNLAWMLAEDTASEAELDRALELAKFAVRLRNGSAGFHDTLGWVHLKRGDGESAVHALSTAVKITPHNAQFQYHLALAYRLDGQPELAREAFAKAVELAPTPRPSWFEEAQAAASQDGVAAEDDGAAETDGTGEAAPGGNGP